jgi:hypothetical protein
MTSEAPPQTVERGSASPVTVSNEALPQTVEPVDVRVGAVEPVRGRASLEETDPRLKGQPCYAPHTPWSGRLTPTSPTDGVRAPHGHWLSTRSGPRHTGTSVIDYHASGRPAVHHHHRRRPTSGGGGHCASHLQNLTRVLGFQPVKASSTSSQGFSLIHAAASLRATVSTSGGSSSGFPGSRASITLLVPPDQLPPLQSIKIRATGYQRSSASNRQEPCPPLRFAGPSAGFAPLRGADISKGQSRKLASFVTILALGDV